MDLNRPAANRMKIPIIQIGKTYGRAGNAFYQFLTVSFFLSNGQQTLKRSLAHRESETVPEAWEANIHRVTQALFPNLESIMAHPYA